MLDVVCSPSYGFHLTSIVERSSGEELLWLAPELPQPSDDLGPPGEASVTSWEERVFIGGWFAMFPSFGMPTSEAGHQTWMHGELGRRSWTVQHTARDPDVVSATVALRSAEWQVRRTVTMTSTGFNLGTYALNVGDVALPFTFGEHPCFARSAFAGGQVHADVTKLTVPVPAANADRALYRRPAADSTRWPVVSGVSGDVAVDVIPDEPDGRLDHLCLEVDDGVVLIAAPKLSGALRLSSRPPMLLRDMLLWERFDLDGRMDVFALEPSSAPGRSFDDAFASGAVRSVSPGAAVSFEVDVDWIPNA